MSIAGQVSPLDVEASLPLLMVEEHASFVALKVSNPGSIVLQGVRITLRSSAFAGGKITWVCPRLLAGRSALESGPLEVVAAHREGRFPVTCDVEYLDASGTRVRGLSTGEADATGMVKLLRGPGPKLRESIVAANVAKELGIARPEGQGALAEVLSKVTATRLPPFILLWESTDALGAPPKVPDSLGLRAEAQPQPKPTTAVAPTMPKVRFLEVADLPKPKRFPWLVLGASAVLVAGGVAFFKQPTKSVEAPTLAPEAAPAIPAPPPGPKFVAVSVAGRGVWFSQYETTVGQFLKYTQSTGNDWVAPAQSGDDLPAMNLTRGEAEAYCQWLTKTEQSGRVYRLPTDEEWSWAVGIGQLETGLKAGKPDISPAEMDGRLAGFPWGPQAALPTEIRTLPGLSQKKKELLPVSDTWLHESGLFGLEGNVREWVATPYDPASLLPVARGGSWGDTDFTKVGSSVRTTSAGKHVTIGFRVCYDGKTN